MPFMSKHSAIILGCFTGFFALLGGSALGARCALEFAQACGETVEPVVVLDTVDEQVAGAAFAWAREASANLIGGFVSHVLVEGGTSLSPTFVPGSSIFGYDFQPYADVLNLGSFNPGETVTVEYEMRVSVDTPGFEAGGRAQIGDPFDLDGTPGFSGTFIGNGVVATESRSWGEVKSLFDQ